MSEYYAKMRQHLLEVAQSLVCDDVVIYLRKEEDRSYGVLFHKPTSSVMSIGYEGVFGISLSSCVKPNKFCGTGYRCLEDGWSRISRKQLDEACEYGLHRLSCDMMRQTNGILLFSEVDRQRYTSLEEYFQGSYGRREDYILVQPDGVNQGRKACCGSDSSSEYRTGLSEMMA